MSFTDDDDGPPSPEDVIDVDEVINMSYVYALHTFIANLEGQVCVYKGDSLHLLDDSNSYWWLVRSVKTQELGYIPADNIETARERLARQNRQRNTVLTLTTAADVLASKAPQEFAKAVKWLETPNGVIVHRFEQEDDEYLSGDEEANEEEDEEYQEEDVYEDSLDDQDETVRAEAIASDGNAQNRSDLELDGAAHNGEFSTGPSTAANDDTAGLQSTTQALTAATSDEYEAAEALQQAVHSRVREEDVLVSSSSDSLNGPADSSRGRKAEAAAAPTTKVVPVVRSSSIRSGHGTPKPIQTTDTAVRALSKDSLASLHGSMASEMSRGGSHDRLDGGSAATAAQNQAGILGAANPNVSLSSIASNASMQRNRLGYGLDEMERLGNSSGSLHGHGVEPIQTRRLPNSSGSTPGGGNTASPSNSSRSPGSRGTTPTSASGTIRSITRTLKEKKGAIRDMFTKGAKRGSKTGSDGNLSGSESALSTPTAARTPHDESLGRGEGQPPVPPQKDTVKSGSGTAASLTRTLKKSFASSVTHGIGRGSSAVHSGGKPSGVATSPPTPTIEVVRVYAGNIQMQAQFATVAVKPNMTVRDLLVEALRKHQGPREDPSEWYINLLHGDSVEMRLKETELVATLLDGLSGRHLPGTSLQVPKRMSGATTGQAARPHGAASAKQPMLMSNPIHIVDSETVRFTLNKRVNLFERNCHLMRVFRYEYSQNGGQMRMYKTVGVQPTMTTRQVIGLLRYKFQVDEGAENVDGQPPKQVQGWKLSAKFGDTETECLPDEVISDVLHVQLRRQQTADETLPDSERRALRRSRNELEFVFAQTDDPRYADPSFILSPEQLAAIGATPVASANVSPVGDGAVAMPQIPSMASLSAVETLGEKRALPEAAVADSSASSSLKVVPRLARSTSLRQSVTVENVAEKAGCTNQSAGNAESAVQREKQSDAASGAPARETSPMTSASLAMKQMEDLLDSMLSSNEPLLPPTIVTSTARPGEPLPARSIPRRSTSTAAASQPLAIEKSGSGMFHAESQDSLREPAPVPRAASNARRSLTPLEMGQVEAELETVNKTILDSRVRLVETAASLTDAPASRESDPDALTSLQNFYRTDFALTEMSDDLTLLLVKAMSVFGGEVDPSPAL